MRCIPVTATVGFLAMFGMTSGAFAQEARQPAKAGNACDTCEGTSPRREHRREERLESVHHPKHVGVDDRAEYLVVFDMRGRGPHRDAGVRDDDVRNAEACTEVAGGFT